jgi:hypothetical protein
MTVEEKVSKIREALARGVTIMADNGLNRLRVSAARISNSSLQVQANGNWEFIGARVPVFSGTDQRIW